MKKILICSIVRDLEKGFDRWLSQLNSLIESTQGCEISLSIFENDSTDNTKKLIKNRGIYSSKLKQVHISTNDFGHPKFGSYENEVRVKNLATYRNGCLLPLSDEDYFLFIESDIKYEASLLTDMVEMASSEKVDILSPCSINVDELYDSWATRVEEHHTHFRRKDYPIDGSVMKVHSTFNCFCLYKNVGIENPFHYINSSGKWDCDTYVICEKYKELGHSNIVMNTGWKVYHGVVTKNIYKVSKGGGVFHSDKLEDAAEQMTNLLDELNLGEIIAITKEGMDEVEYEKMPDFEGY